MVAKTCLAALSLVLLSACAAARSGELRIPNYDHLDRKAADKTSFSLSGSLLRLALKLSGADDQDPDRQLLAQLKRVQVRNPKENEQVDVFICIENGETRGFAVIPAERRGLTIVNIVGAIDLERLHRLEGQLGVPKLGIAKQP